MKTHHAVPKQSDTSNTMQYKSHHSHNVSKRSNIMSNKSFFSRALAALFSVILLAGMAFGQNLNLSGGASSLGGTWNVKGDVNNDGATGLKTFTGTLNMTRTAVGTQNLGGTSATQALSIATFNLTGSRNVIQNVTVSVTAAFDINNGSTPTYDVTDQTLNFGGTTAITSGSFDASDPASVVNYTNTGASQLILASTYGGTLGLQGASTKSFSGATTVATLTHAGGSGALTVNENLTIDGNTASTIDAVTVDASRTLDKTVGGSVTITTLTDNNGTIQSTAGVVRFSNAVVNDGSITTATGEIDFDGDLTISATTGAVTVTGAGVARFGGNVTNNNTFTFGTNSTANYDGTGTQSLPAPSAGNYYNLTLSGNSTKNATGSISLDGNFDNQGTTSLDMGTGSNALSASGTYTQAAGARVRFGGASHGLAINSGIIEYYGNVTQTVAFGTYNTLELTTTGTSTKNIGAGTVSTGQNLTVPASVTLDLTAATSVLGITGNLTVASSGALAVSNSGGIVNISGDFNLDGAITNSGTINVGL